MEIEKDEDQKKKKSIRTLEIQKEEEQKKHVHTGNTERWRPKKACAHSK